MGMRTAWIMVLAAALGAQSPWPETAVERSKHQKTSTVAEVQAFMDALGTRNKALQRYAPAGAPQEAEAGTPLLAWRLRATGKDPLRVYLNGNIHAGEVEGKEAIQLLARELLQGRHPDLRRHVDFVFMPAYNADATDALDPAIRAYQPNPESGVGRRENHLGMDLNRDLMKAAAASTRFFLAMLRDFDPHLVLDLHTTNGSLHTFHLTYAHAHPLGGDEGLADFNHRMLEQVREALKPKGLATYEYGDFLGGEPGRNGQVPTGWGTVDPRPRYLTNYPGLRNRLAVLSECFVYKPYPERIHITRAFVLGCLEWLVAHGADVRQAIQGAEARWVAAWKTGRPALPLASEDAPTEVYPFEAFLPIRNEKGQVIGEKGRQAFQLPALTTFKPLQFVPTPDGYLVDPAYAAEVRPILEAHGLVVLPGSRRPKVPLRHFHETSRELAKDTYQGVFNLTLQGSFQPTPAPRPHVLAWRDRDLDRALYIPLNQPRGRLAFYLLDPRSNDGLVHWGLFHSALVRGRGMWGEPPRFPILALGDFTDAPAVPGNPVPAKKAE